MLLNRATESNRPLNGRSGPSRGLSLSALATTRNQASSTTTRVLVSGRQWATGNRNADPLSGPAINGRSTHTSSAGNLAAFR